MDYDIINEISIRFTHLEKTESTNLYIKQYAHQLSIGKNMPEMWIVTTDSQTAGRGQQGTVWFSESGKNLLMSIMIRPKYLTVKDYYTLSVATALALKNAMAKCDIETLIKWPNDIYYKNYKLAGILLETECEATYISQAIIGIGLNINQKSFGLMSRNPISMSAITGKDFNRDKIKKIVIEEFTIFYKMILQGNKSQLFTVYTKSLMGYGHHLLYKDANGEFIATVHNIKPDGHIILKRQDGTLSTYTFKEVETVICGH